MTPTALVLAAGAGRRLGVPKALATWSGVCFLDHVLARLAAVPDLGRPVVVTGARAGEVGRLARAAGARPVHNPDWEEGGMLGSLLRGLDAVEGAPAILLWPVDHPAVSSATVEALIGVWRAERPAAVVPTTRHGRGHPVIFDQGLFPALRAAPPGQGARAVVRALGEEVREVRVGDEGIHLDIDTPDALAKLAR